MFEAYTAKFEVPVVLLVALDANAAVFEVVYMLLLVTVWNRLEDEVHVFDANTAMLLAPVVLLVALLAKFAFVAYTYASAHVSPLAFEDHVA